MAFLITAIKQLNFPRIAGSWRKFYWYWPFPSISFSFMSLNAKLTNNISAGPNNCLLRLCENAEKKSNNNKNMDNIGKPSLPSFPFRPFSLLMSISVKYLARMKAYYFLFFSGIRICRSQSVNKVWRMGREWEHAWESHASLTPDLRRQSEEIPLYKSV